MDAIPPGLLDGLSTVGLVILFALGLATGRLFTRRQYDEVTHDRDEWRTESRLKDAQIAEKDVQLRHLAEVGKTVEQLARGLQQRMKP
jgi:hypothetical protein